MTTFASDPALRLYALVATIVCLHVGALAGWTGVVRTQRKVYVNPEDAAAFKAAAAESDHPDVLRVKRAHQNALENALLFLGVGFLYAISSPPLVGAQAYFYTFLAARVLHSVFYLWGKQPFRSIMFTIGQLAILGMGVHVIRVAL